MKWNKCSEKLPETLHRVLTVDRSGLFYVADIDYSGIWTYSDCCGCSCIPEFWAELPEPPKQ